MEAEMPARLHDFTPSPYHAWPAWAYGFLEAFRTSGVVLYACDAVGISRPTAYDLRRWNHEFAEAWEVAKQEATDLLELEAIRRGREGVNEPVFYKGQLCGNWFDAEGKLVDPGTPGARFVPLMKKRYSDRLLAILLSANRPKKYRRAAREVDVKVAGKVKHVHSVCAEIDELDREYERMFLAAPGPSESGHRANGEPQSVDSPQRT